MSSKRNPAFLFLVVLTSASPNLPNTMGPDFFGTPLLQIPADLMNNMPLHLHKQLYEQASKSLSRTRRTVASANLPNTKDPNSFLTPLLQLMNNIPLNLQKQLYEQAIKPVSRSQRYTTFRYRPFTVPAFPRLSYVPPAYRYRTFPYYKLNPFIRTRPYFNWFQSRPAIVHQFPKLMMSRNPVFTQKLYTSPSKPTRREKNSVKTKPYRSRPTLVTFNNPIDDDDDYVDPDLTPDTKTRYEGSTTYKTEPDSSFITDLSDTGSTDEVNSKTEPHRDQPTPETHTNPIEDDDSDDDDDYPDPDLTPDTKTRYEGSTTYTTEPDSSFITVLSETDSTDEVHSKTVPHRDQPTLVTHTNPIEDDDDYLDPELTPDKKNRYKGSTTYRPEPDSSFITALSDTSSTDEVNSSSDDIEQMLSIPKNINDDEVINETESSNSKEVEPATPSYNSTSGNDNNEKVDNNDKVATDEVNSSNDKIEQMLSMIKSIHDIVSSNAKEVEPASPSYNSTSSYDINEKVNNNDTGSANELNSSSDKFEQMLTMLNSIYDIVSSNSKKVEPATPSHNTTSGSDTHKEFFEEFPPASIKQTNKLSTSMLPGSQNVTQTFADNNTNTSQAFYNINSSAVSNPTETQKYTTVKTEKTETTLDNFENFSPASVTPKNELTTTMLPGPHNVSQNFSDNNTNTSQAFYNISSSTVSNPTETQKYATVKTEITETTSDNDKIEKVFEKFPPVSVTQTNELTTTMLPGPQNVSQNFSDNNTNTSQAFYNINSSAVSNPTETQKYATVKTEITETPSDNDNIKKVFEKIPPASVTQTNELTTTMLPGPHNVSQNFSDNNTNTSQAFYNISSSTVSNPTETQKYATVKTEITETPSDNDKFEKVFEKFPPASVTQTNELTTTMLLGSQNVTQNFSDNNTNTLQAFYNINSSAVSNPTEIHKYAMAKTEITENTSRVNQFYSSNLMKNYFKSVDIFDRHFYQTTFAKLRNSSAEGREENGISFAQSGLFLHMALTGLAPAVDEASRAEIENATHYMATDPQRRDVLKSVLSWLPQSSATLKFRRATRLVAAPAVSVAEHFLQQSADVGLQVDRLNGTDDPAYLAKTLNDMVVSDSGGSLRQTFEEEEVSGGVRAALLSTLYLRASWRTAPTLLNQSQPFRDPAPTLLNQSQTFRDPARPDRTTRALRLTDLVGYANLPDWDAEAIEIQYSEPELSLLLVVPRAPSLRALGQRLAAEGISPLLAQLRPRRLAVIMPLYTLRMTLLLPNKLQSMGVNSLVSPSPGDSRELRLSHAVQRVMFWAEAGRNAYKDDGIQWDDPPEFEMVVDRPYAFFVRWRNVTLMNGHFVL